MKVREKKAKILRVFLVFYFLNFKLGCFIFIFIFF